MICSGCGTPRGKLFEVLDKSISWPSPPDQPRITYLGQLKSEDDLKKEVSSIDAFGRFFFGRDDIGVLETPYGLALDSQDRLFIADSSGSVIHMMNLKTRNYKQFSKMGKNERLISPIALVIVNNKIFVADSVLAKICVFSIKDLLWCIIRCTKC